MYQIEEYKNIINLLGKNLENLAGKSMLVTGACGLIGSYLTDFFIHLNEKFDFGIKIYAASRSYEKIEKRFKKAVNAIELDLNTEFKITENFDYIIHGGGFSHHGAFLNNPVETLKTNIMGTAHLLDSIKNKNTKFLFLSSGAVYGNKTDEALIETDATETDVNNSIFSYPISKMAAEAFCMAYHKQFSMNVNIARLCYVYGPVVDKNNTRIDVQLLKSAVNNENLILQGRGLQKRSYCYVADAATGILFILLKGVNGEIYNISNPNSIVSIQEFAKTVAEISGVNLTFENKDKDYGKIHNAVLNSSKLMRLGFKCFYDINDGIKHSLIMTI